MYIEHGKCEYGEQYGHKMKLRMERQTGNFQNQHKQTVQYIYHKRHKKKEVHSAVHKD
jgi:hypothetical protein